MKTRKIFAIVVSVILICNFLFVVPISAQESNDGEEGAYVVTTYDDRNGLPTGEANTVLHSSDGYIWIGSYGKSYYL